MPKNISVLFCCDTLGFGGIETWLINLMRIKPEGIQFDFLLEENAGGYEEEAEKLGACIYYLPKRNKWRKRLENYHLFSIPNKLKEILKNKRYDVIHTQDYKYTGKYLKIASKYGVPIRIAHSHSTMWNQKKGSRKNINRYIYHHFIDAKLIDKYATHILSCGDDAGNAYVPKLWPQDKRCKIIYCGVPLDKFYDSSKLDKNEVRKRFGIPQNSIVIGHTGNANPVKNQQLILKIFKELADRDPRYHLLMIGLGGQIEWVQNFIKENNLSSRVTTPGLRNDVSDALVHCFDMYLMPSIREGLPVSWLESVAAGLYSVCSDRVPYVGTGLFKHRVTTVSLDRDVTYWADRVVEAVKNRISVEDGIKLLDNSPFSIKNSLKKLFSIYN